MDSRNIVSVHSGDQHLPFVIVDEHTTDHCDCEGVWMNCEGVWMNCGCVGMVLDAVSCSQTHTEEAAHLPIYGQLTDSFCVSLAT